MKKYLSEEEFNECQEDLASGKAQVVVPRSISRQFFVRVDNKSIKATTAESVIPQKLAVWSGVVLSPLLLVACGLVLILELGWMAALAIPIIGVFWAVLGGFTSESGSWHDVTGAVALTLAALLIYANNYTLALLLFALSLWVHRMTYILAQNFLKQIVSSSFAAYDMLVDHVTIDRESPAE